MMIDEPIEGAAQYQDAGKRRPTGTLKAGWTAGEIPRDTDIRGVGVAGSVRLPRASLIMLVKSPHQLGRKRHQPNTR